MVRTHKKLVDICIPNGIVRGPFGGSLKKEIFVSQGYKIYEQQNAIYQNVEFGRYYVNKEKYTEMSRFAIRSGDFIVSCSGTIGRIYRIPENYPEGIINQALLKLTINNNVINPEYFYYYFSWEKFQKIIIDDTQGGAMKNLVGMNIFKEVPILLPDSKEQVRIANALSDVDSLIESLEKLIAKKKAIKQGTMQELLTGKKRIEGFSGKWITVKLEDICNVIMGQSPDSRYYNDRHGTPLIQGNADLVNRKTIERVYTEYVTKKAYVGEIIFTVRAPVGNVAIASSDCCIGRGVCALRNGNEFLFQYLIFIEKSWNTLSAGSTFDSINTETLNNFTLKLPSTIEEQKAISSILSDMDSEIDKLELKLTKYRQIKQGMMSELLTGRIRLVYYK